MIRKMITRFVPGYATNQLRRLARLNHPVEPLPRGHTRSRTTGNRPKESGSGRRTDQRGAMLRPRKWWGVGPDGPGLWRGGVQPR